MAHRGYPHILGPVSELTPPELGMPFGGREATLEERYPTLADAITTLRERGVSEQQLSETLRQAESTLKKGLKGDFTPAEVDVHIFGRKPGVARRFLGAAGRAMTAGLIAPGTPEEQEQIRTAGGAPQFLGQLAGSLLPFTAASKMAGALPWAARHPFLADVGVGAGLEATEQLTGEREASLGGIATQGLLFGGIGAAGRALTKARRPLPGTRPPPAEPAAPRVPPGAGPFEPGGESPLFGRQEPLGRGSGGGPEARPFIAGGESAIAGRDLVVPLSAAPAAEVVRRAPGWVQDIFQGSERPISALMKAERQPAEAMLKQHFGSRPRVGYEDELTLNMGFNPLALLGKPLRAMLGAGGEAEAAALRAAPKSRLFSRLRTRQDIFRDTAFLSRLQPAREQVEDTLIRFGNLLDDIVKPLSKEDKNGPLIDALNSETFYNAASPAIRAVADRVRGEVLTPVFDLLKATPGVRSREGLQFLPYYFRHILDRRETMGFIRKAMDDFAGAGEFAKSAEMNKLLERFALRGNAAVLMDEDAARLFGANARDFFKDVAPAEAGFGALERRLANLPTFIRDFDLVMDSYLRGAARKIAFDPILKGLSEDIALLDAPLRERAVKVMREYLGLRHPSAEAFDGSMRAVGLKLHDLFGVHPLSVAERFRAEDVSRMATVAEYYRTLYGNGGGAIVNMLQTATNTYPALAQKYGGAEAASLMVRAIRMGLTADGRAVIREMIGTKGAKAAALEGRPKTMEGLVGWGDFFGLVETGFNQRIAGLAEYLAHTERGVAHDAAVKAGRRFTDITQFRNLDPLRRPEILSGPAGRFLGQFQSFKLNQLDFFLNELDKTGKAYFVGIMAALGGPSALPFLGPWMKEYTSFTSPLTGQQTDVGAGLPGLVGLDIARRLNPAEQITRALTGRPEEFPTRAMQSTTGPGVGLALGLFEAVNRYANAAPYAGRPTALWYAAQSALRELEPVAATRLAKAHEVSQTGQLRAGQPSGLALGARMAGLPVPPARFGGASLGLQAGPGEAFSSPLGVGLGVPTQRQRELDQMVQEQRQAVEGAKAQRTAIATAYLHYKATGDSEPLRAAIRSAPGADARQILMDLERPAERRIQQGTPRRFRAQMQEELQ